MVTARTKIIGERAAVEGGPAVVAAGFFDGCHIGHQAVLNRAIGEARATGARAWVLTFPEHPRAAVAQGAAPPLLSTTEARLDAFAKAGFDGVCLLEFDSATAALAPAEFASGLLGLFPGLRFVCTGGNWRFGRGAEGDAALLAALGAKMGFATAAVPVALYGGSPVSSTRIRAAVADGALDDAAAMLGRRFSIRGTVIRGRQIGSANGFATANIVTDGLALPPIGVYAVESAIDGAAVRGVADLGWRPTFPGARPDSPILEAHFFGVSRPLYGETLDVAFLKRLRDERAFPSQEELFRQITLDAAQARAL